MSGHTHVKSFQQKDSWDCEGTGEFACTANFDNTRTIVYGMLEVNAMEKYNN